ncbi:MAG: helix-turn-helix domain-containing protein [Candidatus Gastranaerophilales bacterium]|nr:helix-turn-helix domain-containing protein [Candidatus Gastranaerophilales bacterium]
MSEDTTLAKFISDLREKQGFSQVGLARKANLDLKVLEDIEGAQEFSLSVVTRQKLARALKVEPRTIKKYERVPEKAKPDEGYIETLKENILAGYLDDNLCPMCGAVLVCRVAEMYDLENKLIRHPKAHCTKCPFQIK